MKPFVWFCCMMGLFPAYLQAQNKDSLHLVCPLEEAVIVTASKDLIHYDVTDFCIVLVSISDTAVKAVTNGKITNVARSDEEEGKWDVVFVAKFKNKEYYFWYSGITRIVVKKNDVIKEGQPIGYIKPGEKIELLMYDFETPVDPAKYLDCKFLKVQGRNMRVVSRM